MSDTVISVENLSKKYLLTHLADKREQLFSSLLTNKIKNAGSRVAGAFKRGSAQEKTVEDFWALKDVSFEIKQGDRVGIIGRNGAGKSTLLKILSRITEPTKGRITIDGRVASLLEVGTGFHSELSGRENIYLNGAILGMSREEIKRKFDEIVDFAEVEQFLDTPVKRYSSGMYVRLAFAVAAHLEPEILIVDEVLAVGDAQFQKKCLGKMEDVSTKEGRTVLFVSHNMAAIHALCNKGIMLQKGQIELYGSVEDAISKYVEVLSEEASFDRTWNTLETAPGNEHLRLHRVRLVPLGGGKPEEISIRTPFNIEIEYWNLKPDTCLSFSMHLVTPEEAIAFASTTWQEEHWNGKPFKGGLYRSVCQMPGDLLNVGPYRMRLHFLENGNSPVCKLDDILSFELLDSEHDRGVWHGKWDGAVRPNLKWTTTIL
jgi:lipopolysaccharide transport system ATP-binding protein